MVTVARFILGTIAPIGESGERTSWTDMDRWTGHRQALPVWCRSVDGCILVAIGAGFQLSKRSCFLHNWTQEVSRESTRS